MSKEYIEIKRRGRKKTKDEILEQFADEFERQYYACPKCRERIEPELWNQIVKQEKKERASAGDSLNYITWTYEYKYTKCPHCGWTKKWLYHKYCEPGLFDKFLALFGINGYDFYYDEQGNMIDKK